MSWNATLQSLSDRNRVSTLALIASDASYFTGSTQTALDGKLRTLPQSASGPALPVSMATQVGATPVQGANGVFEVPGWVVFESLVEPTTGFQAVTFRNITTREVIVAFQGTNPGTGADWYTNLNLGINQWREETRNFMRGMVERALTDPNSETSPLTVHFTGHSLGGALAQYAAYDWLEQNSLFEKSRMTLTTFNGLSGHDGLRVLHGNTFNSALLVGVRTAHYAIDNDFVHRLGGGHLNGAGNSHMLNFWQDMSTVVALNQRPVTVRRIGTLLETHVLSTGFYRGFGLANADFVSVAGVAPLVGVPPVHRNQVFAYLPAELGAAQDLAAAFAGLLNDADNKGLEGWARTAFGLMMAIQLTPVELQAPFTRALIDNFRRAATSSQPPGAIPPLLGSEWDALSAVLPGALKVLALTPVTVKAQGMAIAVSVLAEVGDVAIGALPAQQLNAAAWKVTDLDGVPVASLMLPQSLLQIALRDRGLVALRLLSAEGAGVAPAQWLQLNVDAGAVLSRAVSTGNWRGELMSYFAQRAQAQGVPTAALLASVMQVLGDAASVAYSSLADGGTQLRAALTDIGQALVGVVKGFANGYAQFTAKFADALHDPGSLGRTVLAGLSGELRAAFGLGSQVLPAVGPESPPLRAAQIEAVRLLEGAASKVEILPGAPANPFDAPGYDPDARALPVVNTPEGRTTQYTLFLPFAAPEGGQRASVLSTYAAQTTRAGQQALLDSLIGEWAATSAMDSGGGHPRGRRRLCLGRSPVTRPSFRTGWDSTA